MYNMRMGYLTNLEIFAKVYEFLSFSKNIGKNTVHK